MKIEIYKSIYSYRKLPKNINKLNIKNFSHELKKLIPASYIHVKLNVYLVNQSLISFKNFTVFSKYTHYPNNKKIDVLKLSLKNLYKGVSKKRKTYNQGIWIFDDKVNVYYHWLFDSLQRYLLIPERYKDYPVLVPQIYNLKWVKEHLDFLGINYRVVENNKIIKIKKIIIPSYSAPSGNFNKNVVTQLRKLYLKSVINLDLEIKYERIWIERNNSRRNASNKDEIKKIINKYNFHSIDPANLEIQEVIKIINGAKIIAGLHGSGLANILFANKNTTLIDIRERDDNYRNALFSLASDLGIEYYCFNETILDEKNDSVYLDPQILEKLLSETLEQ